MNGEPMRFEDIPLAKYESEVFCEVGVWKNYDELEESLTLDELFLTYEATAERQNRLLKTVASAMGASVEDERVDDSLPPGTFIDDKGNAVQLFGYSKVDKID